MIIVKINKKTITFIVDVKSHTLTISICFTTTYTNIRINILLRLKLNQN